jgi:hypothetical protein
MQANYLTMHFQIPNFLCPAPRELHQSPFRPLMFNDLAISHDIPVVPKLWSAEHWGSATQVTPKCSTAEPEENETFYQWTKN